MLLSSAQRYFYHMTIIILSSGPSCRTCKLYIVWLTMPTRGSTSLALGYFPRRCLRALGRIALSNPRSTSRTKRLGNPLFHRWRESDRTVPISRFPSVAERDCRYTKRLRRNYTFLNKITSLANVLLHLSSCNYTVQLFDCALS